MKDIQALKEQYPYICTEAGNRYEYLLPYPFELPHPSYMDDPMYERFIVEIDGKKYLPFIHYGHRSEIVNHRCLLWEFPEKVKEALIKNMNVPDLEKYYTL